MSAEGQRSQPKLSPVVAAGQQQGERPINVWDGGAQNARQSTEQPAAAKGGTATRYTIGTYSSSAAVVDLRPARRRLMPCSCGFRSFALPIIMNIEAVTGQPTAPSRAAALFSPAMRCTRVGHRHGASLRRQGRERETEGAIEPCSGSGARDGTARDGTALCNAA